jgi:hypothetical protein
MGTGELFGREELRQAKAALTPARREAAIRDVIKSARLGAKYFYTLREACAILRVSYDELDTILYRYRLDAVLFLTAYRIPWYEICSYLLDDEDDLEEALDEYIKANTRRDTRGCETRRGRL